MSAFLACICMYTVCLVPMVSRKGCLDVLKLELQTVVRNLIGLGAESGFSTRVENALKPLSSLSCSMVSILNFISSSGYFQ